MKRGLIIAAMLVAIIFASVSVSKGETDTFEPETEVIEFELHSSKPVMVPYLDFDIEHLSCIRKENEYASRFDKGNVEGTAQNESVVRSSEQASGEFSDGGSESGESVAVLSRGGEGGTVNDEETAAEEYQNAEAEIFQEETGNESEQEAEKSDPVGNESVEGLSESAWSTDGSIESGNGDTQTGLTYLGDWTITAYCACQMCCGEWSTGCTASGVLATANHTVACNVLPFGTQIKIGDVIYTVEDTGYSPYGDAWADVFFDSHEEALMFGVKTMEVYLVE